MRDLISSCVWITAHHLQDANLGLLEQVIASIPSRRILKLKEHYSKLRMSDIASKLDLTDSSDLQSLEALLQHMVCRINAPSGVFTWVRLIKLQIAYRVIRATVHGTGPSAIVDFMEDDVDYTSPQALTRLKQVNHLAQMLEQELTRSGRELGIHRDYLKKVGTRVQQLRHSRRTDLS